LLSVIAHVSTLPTGYLRIQASRQDKENGVHLHTATCAAAPDPASLPRWAPVLPRASWHRTPAPCSGGLQCCRVSHGSGPRLCAWEGTGATMCHMTLVLPHVTWLWTLPPCLGGLQCCHVPHDFRACLPTREVSNAITCPATLRGP
jgi:hypothetical protein